jgi:hypothetical protein
MIYPLNGAVVFNPRLNVTFLPYTANRKVLYEESYNYKPEFNSIKPNIS